MRYALTSGGGWNVTAAGGITIVAPAGMQVLIPGGNRRADSFHFWTSTMEKKTGGFKLEIVGFSSEIVGVETGFTNYKYEETGAFFDRPEPAALAEAVASFDALGVDPEACVDNARRFDSAQFRRGLKAVVDQVLDGSAARRGPRRRPPRLARGLARPA